jgi:predicted nucleotidyltransferase
MTTADVMQTMTDRIVRDFHPLQIILFGSHARGDAGPESDIDLLVVLPQVANKRLAAVAIRRALADLPVCKDIVVTTPGRNRPPRRSYRYSVTTSASRGQGAV